MTRPSLLIAFLIVISSSVSSAEVDNTGRILAIGKVNANACRIRVEGANLTAACPTAVYGDAYFTCNSTDGKEFLSIALAAYLSQTPIRITSNACSIYGSSVANVVAVNIE